MTSCSPQETLCPSRPALFSFVRYPSLPASSSFQSSPSILHILDACCTCSAFIPNVRHLPIRSFASESHLGDSAGSAAPFECSEESGLEGRVEALAVEAKDRETRAWERHWSVRVRPVRTLVPIIVALIGRHLNSIMNGSQQLLYLISFRFDPRPIEMPS